MTGPQIIDIDPLAPPPPRIIEDNSHRRVGGGTPRPKGVHTKHLTELERFRVRTLYYDACLSKGRIRQITGYSASQIRTAVRAQSATVGKRPGRPKNLKKGGKSSKANAEPPTPNGSDASAELIQQAKRYFARQDSSTPDEGDEDDNENDDGGSEDEEGEDENENDDDTPRNAQTSSTSASSAQAPATGLTRAVPVRTGVPALATPTATEAHPPPHPHRQNSKLKFNALPLEVRIYIWRCVLSTAPTQLAPSRSWALAVLPGSPWLELGMTPAHVGRLDNPPWSHYVDMRHVPATVLTRVSREARGVVLARCTPVVVSRPVREASRGIPLFVWIDRYSDVIHFFGEKFRTELFEMAGRSACPELYR
ncbi:hypothetical protein F5Y10DRAFT_11904 [Nemania abortiva]|nr:hypothetical protein F5Y10DRAFT_11904 [Nemania abortiva]